eukprot:m.159308 g.159308  ORF g.159308 m.159308 type:complete len:224 (-) comp16488_c0_seq2:2524-3195(-)
MACPSVLFWVAVLSASLPTSQSNRFLKSFEIHVDSYSSRLAALDDYITCCEGNVQGINPPKCVKANEPTVRSACLNEIEACLLEDPALPVPVTTADLTAGDEVVLLRAKYFTLTSNAFVCSCLALLHVTLVATPTPCFILKALSCLFYTILLLVAVLKQYLPSSCFSSILESLLVYCYINIILPLVTVFAVAYFGHGRLLQAHNQMDCPSITSLLGSRSTALT